MTTDQTDPRPDWHAAEPLALRLNDQLGPLPEPPAFYRYQFQSHYGLVWRSSAENWNGCPPLASEGLYSADQMRAYAAQERAAERERCAKIVDVPPETEAWEVIGGEEGLTMLRELAAQIRGA